MMSVGHVSLPHPQPLWAPMQGVSARWVGAPFVCPMWSALPAHWPAQCKIERTMLLWVVKGDQAVHGTRRLQRTGLQEERQKERQRLRVCKDNQVLHGAGRLPSAGLQNGARRSQRSAVAPGLGGTQGMQGKAWPCVSSGSMLGLYAASLSKYLSAGITTMELPLPCSLSYPMICARVHEQE